MSNDDAIYLVSNGFDHFFAYSISMASASWLEASAEISFLWQEISLCNRLSDIVRQHYNGGQGIMFRTSGLL